MTSARRITPPLAVLAAIAAILSAGAGRIEAWQQPDPAVLQQHAREGERALAEGRYADAQKAYETLRQLTPAIAEVQARLGLIYFQQGKFADAIAPLREAIRLKPTLPKVDALLAMSLSELGRYDEALPAVTKAFSQSGDPVLRRMAGLHLQRIYTGLGRDRDAVDVALRLSRLYPDDPEVLYHSGRLFANFAYLQTMRLATVAPDSVWLHQAAGEANESQGLYDAAIREYRQVLRPPHAGPGIHFRIGRVLLARSKSDAASARRAQRCARRTSAFEEELALDPTNANAAYELAEMDRKGGELDPARKLFEQAVTHYPTFEQALVGLGANACRARSAGRSASVTLQAALKGKPRERGRPLSGRASLQGTREHRPSRRKRWPSSTGCARSPHGARQRCPRHCGMSPHKCSTSNLRNECKGNSRGHRKRTRSPSRTSGRLTEVHRRIDSGGVALLDFGDLVQRAERRSGDSYLSHSDARLHFGLGSRTTIDSIDVRWPNGAVQRFGESSVNTFIKIVEGAPSPQTIRREDSRPR